MSKGIEEEELLMTVPEDAYKLGIIDGVASCAAGPWLPIAEAPEPEDKTYVLCRDKQGRCYVYWHWRENDDWIGARGFMEDIYGAIEIAIIRPPDAG